MDLSTYSSMNIQSTETAMDLRIYDTILTKGGQRAIYDLSQLRGRQQTRYDRLSIADRQLKRRREFENIFEGEVKKLKLNETITPVTEDVPQNEVEIPMVQIPYSYYRILAIKEQSLDDLDTSNILNILEKTSSLIMQTVAAIKEEPMDVLETSNIFNEVQSAFETSNPSLIQTVSAKPIDELNPTNTSNAADSLSEKTYSSAIGEAPNDELVSSNISNTKNSLSETASSSLLQPVSAIEEKPNDSIDAARDISSAPLIIDCFQLGPNGTYITREQLLNINWTEVSITTRQLLSAIFDRETLATHTLSGKPSPAFLHRDRPLKCQLDKLKVADVIYFIKLLFNCPERVIRNAITMKCADTAKAIRRRSLSKANLDKFL